MNKIFERAEQLKDQIICDRRHLHTNPELGMELPGTVEFVKSRLTEMGYEPKDCGPSGVTATVGTGTPVILLRADMDALPMEEASGLEFASKKHNIAHTCGHDCHTAMLLGAAQILKEHEKDLKGTVKLMFQPGEEIFAGARSMVEHGILESPHVDAALGIHIFPMVPLGTIWYRAGAMMASVDGFEIEITGKGCHGAQSSSGVDPINIAAHTHLALQELISREIDAGETALLTIGSIAAGHAANIIPQTAVMQGTMRTFSAPVRDFLIKRTTEVCESVAKTFRGTAVVKFLYQVSACSCDPAVMEEMKGYAEEVGGGAIKLAESPKMPGSEDFALVAERVPSAFFMLGANFPGKNTITAQHNPGILFNEDSFTTGVAVYANCAIQWLEHHAKH